MFSINNGYFAISTNDKVNVNSCDLFDEKLDTDLSKNTILYSEKWR